MTLLRAMCTAVAFGVLIGPVASGALADETDHAIALHRTVRITSLRLHPETRTLGTDDSVAWLNYSAQIARVSFDAEAAKSIRCDSPTSFLLAGDRLTSIPIATGAFFSLCRFKPGIYTYRVELREGAGQISGPTRQLVGKLVVLQGETTP